MEQDIALIVAQAIWEGGDFTPSEPWSALDYQSRETVKKRAVAAIAAMHEPFSVIDLDAAQRGVNYLAQKAYPNPTRALQALIDAAKALGGTNA